MCTHTYIIYISTYMHACMHCMHACMFVYTGSYEALDRTVHCLLSKPVVVAS